MDIVDIYFAFHRPATMRELVSRKEPMTSAFGHVEAFGYTIDETWFFFDPTSKFSKLLITHLHEEVERLVAEKFNAAEEVFRLTYDPSYFGAPIHAPMNCVTQCAALIGIRAFTIRGFRKRLLSINAEVIHEKRSKGRSSRSRGQA